MRDNRAGDDLDHRAGMLARIQQAFELGAHHGLTANVPHEDVLVDDEPGPGELLAFEDLLPGRPGGHQVVEVVRPDREQHRAGVLLGLQ